MTTSFIALHHGPSLKDAEVVAICLDERVVSDFADRLSKIPFKDDDPVLSAKRDGTNRALRLIVDGASERDEQLQG